MVWRYAQCSKSRTTKNYIVAKFQHCTSQREKQGNEHHEVQDSDNH